MTLKVDLGTQGHTHSLYDRSYLQLYTGYRLDLGVDSDIFEVEDLRKLKISYLALMVDLENEGQTHLCMTFCISGCKHHTDMIFVSILISDISVPDIISVPVSVQFRGNNSSCSSVSVLNIISVSISVF